MARKPQATPHDDRDAPLGAYTIRQFSRAHGISEDMFYKMRRAGWGPATMKVGTRTLISVEAAARWRAEREAASVSVQSNVA